MLEKGFLTEKQRRGSPKRRPASPLTNAMLYLGMLILIVSLTFVLFNLERAEAIVNIWLFFVFVGIFLVVISQFLRRRNSKKP